MRGNLIAGAMLPLLLAGARVEAQSGPAPAGPAPAAPAATSAETLALARELVATAYPEERRFAMFSATADALNGQIRNSWMGALNNDPGAKAIVERRLDRFLVEGKKVLAAHIPALMDAYAQAYAREFSRDELAQLIVFARSPAGGHFFLRSAAIISDPAFAAANQSYLRDIQPLMNVMREELTTELKGYFAAHPPKASSGS
jgi:hypothetical protein